MMFDKVTYRGNEWQTHDLGNNNEHYRITDEGILQLEQVREETLPDTEWPTQPGDEWHGLVGTTRLVHDGWIDVPHTGVLTLSAINSINLKLNKGRVVA